MRELGLLRRMVPVLIALGSGALVLPGLLLGLPLADDLLAVAQIVTAVGLLLGLLSLLGWHLRSIFRRSPGWLNSSVLVLSATLIFALEFVPTTAGLLSSAELSGYSMAVLRYVYQPLATSLLGLLTFFALRASWRALQARPAEAGLILVVAVVFLLAGGPWAAALPGLAEGLQWIRDYPVLGVARGIVLGVSIGALVATVRLLLGIDHPYLDR